MIGALEDAEDYQAFEAAIIADYDAQSAVERELVPRLTSLLWQYLVAKSLALQPTILIVVSRAPRIRALGADGGDGCSSARSCNPGSITGPRPCQDFLGA